MIEKFEKMSVQAKEGVTQNGWQAVDGTYHHEVKLDIDTGRNVVLLSACDTVEVQVALEPFLALWLADALMSAALTLLFRAGGPLDGTFEGPPSARQASKAS